MNAEYANRIDRLRDLMKQQGIDVCLIAHNVDLFYFTGSMQTGYLLVPIEGEPVYYVRKSFVRAGQESAVRVESLGSWRSFGQKLSDAMPAVFRKDSKATVGVPYDTLPVALFERWRQLLPGAQWVDAANAVRTTRMIKSSAEIARIKHAASIADLALQEAIARITPGMTELELIAQVEYILRSHGHLGIMRMRAFNQEVITGMVASGAAAAVPTYFDGPAGGVGLSPASPQGASRERIERSSPILFDVGCCIDGYVIDQTRTLVIGDLPSDLQEAYNTTEHILRETERLLKPGTLCAQLYVRALELVKEAGFEQHFMGYGEDQAKFLGHGIGLEIDEWPVLAAGFDVPLQPGMVIAIEPKFTFPDRGVVGIENTYAISETGFEKLTFSQEGIIKLDI